MKKFFILIQKILYKTTKNILIYKKLKIKIFIKLAYSIKITVANPLDCSKVLFINFVFILVK